MRLLIAAIMFLACLHSASSWPQQAGGGTPVISIGSKTFTESYLLGEIAAQWLEGGGFRVDRQLGLGGTLIAYEALLAGSIDLYPEYTGTLAQAVLQDPSLSAGALREALDKLGLDASLKLGFNNSYALAVPAPLAAARSLSTISDLRNASDLQAMFSHEFLQREDGWPALSAAYGLRMEVAGIEHALAYDALERGQIELTEAYTTDGELIGRDITLLADDCAFFPEYAALLLTRGNLPVAVRERLTALEETINEATMRDLNHRVVVGGETPAAVASDFLRNRGMLKGAARQPSSSAERILGNTLTHLRLTATALLLACLIAIPAALLLSRSTSIARALLYFTGLLQTIPALALLALLIPLFGLGETPAIIALFLYSLLPIVRNTLSGLFSVDPLLKQVATGMGLTPLQQLRLIELPLAAPMILAGVKTAAIVSIGTATLAAFVGAGGLGEPIITGLNLNNHRLILEGALPAAGLAIALELLFELVERITIPAHLRPAER